MPNLPISPDRASAERAHAEMTEASRFAMPAAPIDERFTEYATVAERDAAWIARAIKWSAFILVGGQRFHEDCNSLIEAAAVAAQLEEVCARNYLPYKRALVYAITAEGHAAMVPRADWLAVLPAR